jgi:hypothetical protein
MVGTGVPALSCLSLPSTIMKEVLLINEETKAQSQEANFPRNKMTDSYSNQSLWF